MTSGNRTEDLRRPVATDNGVVQVGTLRTKSWTGTDYPLVRPRRERVYYQNPYRPGEWRYYKAPVSSPRRATTVDHPYSMNYEYKRNTVVTYHTGFVGPFTGTINSVTDSQGNVSHWTSNDDLALISKLRSAVAGSDFNAGVFLAEGHRALDMITNGATRIYQTIRRLKQGNLVGAIDVLVNASSNAALRGSRKPKWDLLNNARKDVAGNWLALQYGWMPILQDVRGAAEFLAHHLNFPLQEVVRVRRRVPGNLTIKPAGSYLAQKAYNVAYGQIKATLKEKNVASMVGLTDPLSVGWELLPYSFVVDWFIPIGSYLQARGLAQSLTGTFVISKTWKEGFSGLKWDPSVSPGRVISGDYDYRRVSLSRTVSTTLAVPLPSMKPLGKVASWRHAENAVALLSQLKR